MEKFKSKVDLHKTYLNHLMVFLITITVGTTNIFIKNDITVIFYIGIFLTIVCMFGYGIIAYKLEKDLKDLK